MLHIGGLNRYYGESHILWDVALTVPSGSCVCVMGRNGVGKTTLLKAIMGLLPIKGGSIRFEDRELAGRPAELRARCGIGYVPQGREIFPQLTVEENLLTGAYTRHDGRARVADDLDKVYGYFPRLKIRRHAIAGYTSGGEQQMTAIGRALMARPKMILLDEPSLGLAPQLVEEIFAIVGRLNREEKVGFLVAEQNTNIALRYAEYGYILENGRIVMDGAAADLLTNEDVKEFYLGLSTAGRNSYRDVKHYRRRKRWLA